MLHPNHEYATIDELRAKGIKKEVLGYKNKKKGYQDCEITLNDGTHWEYCPKTDLMVRFWAK